MGDKKICFHFMGRNIWITFTALREFLRKVANQYVLKKQHKEEATYLADNLDTLVKTRKNSPYFQMKDEKDYQRIKELLFFYHIYEDMVDAGVWIELPTPHLNTEDIEALKSRAKGYGDYRYSVDNGWRGVLAQDLVTKYLQEKGIDVKIYDATTSGIDEYDIKVGRLKLDVKCATQENYVEMTAKVNVEATAVKDYYIAVKYYDSLRVFVIIGYFEHDDLGKYPFKFLYGAPYWGVKLYDAKPIHKLIERLLSESQSMNSKT